MFSLRTTAEKFKPAEFYATIIGHFGFLFGELGLGEGGEGGGAGSHIFMATLSISKRFVFKAFSVHTQTQRRCFH